MTLINNYSADNADIAELARGGRTNVIGFALRLAGRVPFLVIAGRLYGAAALGRMAYAVLIIECAAQLTTNGMRRGLALQFARGDRRQVNEVFNALLVSLIIATPLILLLREFPHVMFPNARVDGWDLLVPFVIVPMAWTDIMLAALAYKFDVKATVNARSIVEPWTITIAALALVPVSRGDGLIGAFALAMIAVFVAAAIPFFRTFGRPRGWRLEPRGLARLGWENLPLSCADAIEWGSRRIDLAILGLFMHPEIVGVYYVAQQVASLPQKLKTSFDPVLGPVMARQLQSGDRVGVAAQINQVGYWIIAAQLGIALTLGLTANGVMGLVGPHSIFVPGTKALSFLLAAEVMASLAVVSESALVYVARKRNLLISVLMIALQAAATFALMWLAPAMGWDLRWQSAGPAMVLAATLLLASIFKSSLASAVLGAKISVLRWPLVWAASAALLAGIAFRQTPEWIELAFGIPIIFGIYCVVLWRFGFTVDDRVLFSRARVAPASLSTTSLDPEMAQQL